MKKIRKNVLISILVLSIVLIYIVFPSYSIAYVRNGSNISPYKTRFNIDEEILQNMNLPTQIHFKLKDLKNENVLILLSFPKNFPLDRRIDIVKSIQDKIAKSKEATASNFKSTNYYIYNSKIFSGLYSERIYNSINGRIFTTDYPFYYKIRVTGTVAGIISNYTSHYRGIRLDTSIYVWGLILSGSAGAGVSVSISPSEATFSYSVETYAPYSTCIWDFNATTIANKAFKVGINNDVRENNSGHWYVYPLYAYRWIYAY